MHIVHNSFMKTVREFGDSYEDAIALLGEASYHAMVNFIATNPHAGDVITGTGGFRKMR